MEASENKELAATKVFGQRLLVDQDPKSAVTASGIITKQGLYPDDAQVNRGRVVAVGQLEGADIKVGDQIVYHAPQFVDQLIQVGLDKKIYAVVEYFSVIAVVETPEGDLAKAIQASKENLYSKIEKDKQEEKKNAPRELKK